MLYKNQIFFLSFFLSIFSLSGFAQSYIKYHNQCNLACEQILAQNYTEAKTTYIDAIESVKHPLAMDMYYLALASSHTKDKYTTTYFLRQAYKESPKVKKLFRQDIDDFLITLSADECNKIIFEDYIYLNKLEPWQKELSNKIYNLSRFARHYDQIYNDSILVYYPLDSALQQIYLDSMKINHKIAAKELKKIILEYGWPGENIIGTNGASSLIYCINDPSWFKELEKKLIKEIDKGNLLPQYFVEISDNVQIMLGLPPLYVVRPDRTKKEAKANCKKIGMPFGEVRKMRSPNMYYY